MNRLFLLAAAANNEIFDKMSEPIIKLIESALEPALGLVGAIGAVYCVILGAKLAKAEEPQEREKAKGALKNAVLGFLLIFILLMLLRVGMPLMEEWYKSVSV